MFHAKGFFLAIFSAPSIPTNRTHLLNPGGQILDEEFAEVVQGLQFPRLEEKVVKTPRKWGTHGLTAHLALGHLLCKPTVKAVVSPHLR